MPKIGGFAASSVAKGFTEDRFAALSERDQGDLLKPMARIAEKAYRRGVQQGDCACGGELRGNLDEWRYGPPLDRAPVADAPRSMTSLARLSIECRYDLSRLGLKINVHPDDWDLRPCWAGCSPLKNASGGARHRGPSRRRTQHRREDTDDRPSFARPEVPAGTHRAEGP